MNKRGEGWQIDRITLDMELTHEVIRVKATLIVHQIEEHSPPLPLILDGEELHTLGVWWNGKSLTDDEFSISKTTLELFPTEHCGELTTLVQLYPSKNTKKQGIFSHEETLLTHCEPHGFRRITWYPDRPNAIAPFQVNLTACEKTFPLAISNGTLKSRQTQSNGLVRSSWWDSTPKSPSLFAIVAGKLQLHEQRFRTKSGREVLLAILSLKNRSFDVSELFRIQKEIMRKFEESLGLEYDAPGLTLAGLPGTAVGAMENRTLFLFNESSLLIDSSLAPQDSLRQRVRVLAHEYAHHWFGGLIPIHDWNETALKEGLARFCDHWFLAQKFGKEFVAIETLSGQLKAESRKSTKKQHKITNIPNDQAPEEQFKPERYRNAYEFIQLHLKAISEESIADFFDVLLKKFSGVPATLSDFTTMVQRFRSRLPEKKDLPEPPNNTNAFNPENKINSFLKQIQQRGLSNPTNIDHTAKQLIHLLADPSLTSASIAVILKNWTPSTLAILLPETSPKRLIQTWRQLQREIAQKFDLELLQSMIGNSKKYKEEHRAYLLSLLYEKAPAPAHSIANKWLNDKNATLMLSGLRLLLENSDDGIDVNALHQTIREKRPQLLRYFQITIAQSNWDQLTVWIHKTVNAPHFDAGDLMMVYPLFEAYSDNIAQFHRHLPESISLLLLTIQKAEEKSTLTMIHLIDLFKRFGVFQKETRERIVTTTREILNSSNPISKEVVTRVEKVLKEELDFSGSTPGGTL